MNEPAQDYSLSSLCNALAVDTGISLFEKDVAEISRCLRRDFKWLNDTVNWDGLSEALKDALRVEFRFACGVSNYRRTPVQNTSPEGRRAYPHPWQPPQPEGPQPSSV